MIFLIWILFFYGTIFSSENNQSIFSQEIVVQNSPVIQLDFAQSILPNYIATSISGLSTSGSGTVTQGTGMAFLRTGVTANSAAILGSDARLTYSPGQGLVAMMSVVFTTGVANNTQIIGIGNSVDGFFFGYNGTSFGILYRNNSVDTWIPQASWNGDVMDGSGESGITLVPINGNVYKIQYHWLGFGVVKFYIANPGDGEFILVHSLRLLNNQFVPILTNASMQLLAANINQAGAATNVTLQTASLMGAVQGKTSIMNNIRYAYTKNFTTNAASINNLFTMRNQFTYSSSATNNQTMIYPDTLSLYNAGTTAMRVSIYLNTTNTYTYTNINTNNSVAEVSNAAGENTVVSGGVLIYFVTIPPSKSEFLVDLSKLGLRLAPGESLTIAAQRTSGTNVRLHASLSWTEGL